MKTSIWFSRHQPTAEQVADASAMGYEITAIESGKALGSISLKDDGDVKAVVSGVLGLVAEHSAVAIFGVWPNDVQAQWQRTADDAVQIGGWGDGDIPCFGASNVSRSVEGGKPTFDHRTWKLVGHLNQASCRWLG